MHRGVQPAAAVLNWVLSGVSCLQVRWQLSEVLENVNFAGSRHVLLTKNVQVTDSQAYEEPGAEQREKISFFKAQNKCPNS